MSIVALYLEIGEELDASITANMNYCLVMEETGEKKGRFCPR
jgi:hypothetical protein